MTSNGQPGTPMHDSGSRTSRKDVQINGNGKMKQDPDDEELPSDGTVSNNERKSRLTKFTQEELSAIYHKWNKRYRHDGLTDNRKHFIDRISVISTQIESLILVCKSQATCSD